MEMEFIVDLEEDFQIPENGLVEIKATDYKSKAYSIVEKSTEMKNKKVNIQFTRRCVNSLPWNLETLMPF